MKEKFEDLRGDMVTSRRSLLLGGTITAAATSLFANTPSYADSHEAPLLTTGHQVASRCSSNGETMIAGITAIRTPMRIEFGDNDEAHQIDGGFDFFLLHDLMAAHYSDGPPPFDPAASTYHFFISEERARFLHQAAEEIYSNESEYFDELRDADAYWVQVNPWFLVVLKPIATYCLIPFVTGFTGTLGVIAANWIVERLEA